MLFEDEKYNISEIHNVVRYAPRGDTLYKYPAKLPSYELMYFSKGEVVVSFHGQTISVEAGDVLYLPRGLENGEYTMRQREAFELYNVYFQTDMPMPMEAIRIRTERGMIESLYGKIYRTWKGKKEGYYYKAMQEAYHIFELLRRAQERYSPKEALSCLEEVGEYMAEHYCDLHFDYGMLCFLSGRSYSYFKKLFINKYGCPPVKYVTLLKVNRAAELLEAGKFTVSEVAQLCGFDNVCYFSNVFKKYKGISPRAYQKT